MKQLKVIVNDDLSLSKAKNGAYLTANFVSPIDIPKHSQICLDKFNATSKNISQNFGVVQQVFGVDINGETDNFTQITVPAGNYPTITAYMNAINNLVNQNAISSYYVNAVPGSWEQGSSFYDLQRQASMSLVLQPVGLKSIWTATIYGFSPISTISSPFWLPTENLLTDSSGNHYSNDLNTAKLTSGELVMQGGGLCLEFHLDLSADAADVDLWTLGFISSDGAKTGGRISQQDGELNLYLKDDNGNFTEVTDSETLFPEAYAGSEYVRFMIIQKEGYFGLVYTSNVGSPVPEIKVIGLPGTPYAGKLGTWTFPESYTVVLETGATPVVAEVYYTPATGGTTNLFGTPDDTQTTIDLNKTASNQLCLTLGFNPAEYQLEPYTNDVVSTITSQNIYNVNQLRSAFELAIEILDIPLKNYYANTDPGARSFGRQNVICYFTPVPSVETEGLYSFANSTHQWLDIDNINDTVLQSLSFRVFNPYTGVSFVSNSLGFNLLIKGKDENTIE
jgi:hypothetical protein